jgi:hypothetical protein
VWTQAQIDEIVNALRHLPGDKLLEAKKFVLDLKERFGCPTPVDCSDAWTREDELDFSRESLLNLEARDPWIKEEPGHGTDAG